MPISNVTVNQIATRNKFNEIISAINKLGISWVNFNGNSITIRASSSDIVSVTNFSEGEYEFNFATPKSNANYTIIGNCKAVSGNDTGYVMILSQSVDKFRIRCHNDDGGHNDSETVCIIINTSE